MKALNAFSRSLGKNDERGRKGGNEREKEGEMDEGRGREKRERGNAKILF